MNIHLDTNKLMDAHENTYRNIELKPADNGLILSWTKYTPSSKHSESMHDEHKKIFKMSEMDEALSEMMKLHKDNLKMYNPMMMGKEHNSEKGEY